MNNATPPPARTADELRAAIARLRPYWHSPFDFGQGVQVGDWKKKKRFDRRLRLFALPESLKGKRVLDIGSWDGYWSVELERRGGEVTAIDLWTEQEQLDQFLFVRQHFGSAMEYKKCDVQELDASVAGTFDVVFCAGVLYHLRYPLATLERIRSVTRELLVLETVCMVPFVHGSFPMMAFFPGDRPAVDSGRQWGISGAATVPWLVEALKAAGFARVEVKYKPSFVIWRKLKALFKNSPQGGRVVLHAYVNP